MGIVARLIRREKLRCPLCGSTNIKTILYHDATEELTCAQCKDCGISGYRGEFNPRIATESQKVDQDYGKSAQKPTVSGR